MGIRSPTVMLLYKSTWGPAMPDYRQNSDIASSAHTIDRDIMAVTCCPFLVPTFWKDC